MKDSAFSRFVPRPSLAGGHAMTIYSWGNPRYFPRLPAPTLRYFDVDAESRIIAECHWQPHAHDRPTLIVLHGLNGSSGAHYMRGLATKAFSNGLNVVRLNQRNCGDTEHLSAGLFHSGLTADVAHVVHELAEIDGLPAMAVAGYSLGGNLALKLAGEFGAHPPPALRAVAAVSPIIEIGECVAALERKDNILYQWNFVRDLKRRIRRKARLRPGIFDLAKLPAIRTVREFDDTYTAPHFGFRGAEDYYRRASAMRVIDRIRLPALVIAADDDPFVPGRLFRDPAITRQPHVDLRLCDHGGHCGFVGPTAPDDDGYWAERQVVEFAMAATTVPAAASRIPAPSPPLRA